MRLSLVCTALLAAAGFLAAQSLSDFQKRVTEFSLSNGMHFIVLERHDAPVVSFQAYVNAGSVDDPGGKSSTAHMFEHMIGKGTTTVGTTNWPAEKLALAEVERLYDAYDQIRAKSPADTAAVKAAEARLDTAIAKADSYVDPNAYVRVIEENGAAGFNASTGADSTNYYYSLPSNRAELWFELQSEWFRRPVFREFYKERDVVREERRMRIESSAVGKLQENLLATAFTAHPYRVLVGWASDIEHLRAKDAEQFFQTYYVPGNITIAIVGDVNGTQMKAFAEKYFGTIPARPMPLPLTTTEPVQEGERRVEIETPSQPYVMIAYKRPNQNSPEDAVLDVIEEILSNAHTGTLHTDMVRDKKIALAIGASSTLPAGKYPNLFVVYAMPMTGKTVEENEKECYAVLDRLKNEKIDDQTLARVKLKIRASMIRQLDSNSGLATQLAYYHVNYGTWTKMFTGMDEIDKVSAADIQNVARKILVESNRTVAFTVPPKSPTPGTRRLHRSPTQPGRAPSNAYSRSHLPLRIRANDRGSTASTLSAARVPETAPSNPAQGGNLHPPQRHQAVSARKS